MINFLDYAVFRRSLRSGSSGISLNLINPKPNPPNGFLKLIFGGRRVEECSKIRILLFLDSWSWTFALENIWSDGPRNLREEWITKAATDRQPFIFKSICVCIITNDTSFMHLLWSIAKQQQRSGLPSALEEPYGHTLFEWFENSLFLLFWIILQEISTSSGLVRLSSLQSSPRVKIDSSETTLLLFS